MKTQIQKDKCHKTQITSKNGKIWVLKPQICTEYIWFCKPKYVYLQYYKFVFWSTKSVLKYKTQIYMYSQICDLRNKYGF